VESKRERDRLKQRDRQKQSKKAAVEAVDKLKLPSSGSAVVSDSGRTGGTEEKMDV